jgi:DNA-binding response OmpR family regulator
MTGESDEAEGRALGAVDYVIKPFDPAFLLQCVKDHIKET